MKLLSRGNSRIAPAALTVTALGLFATGAHAHPGHGGASGFAHGFSHPIGGLDHILAMIAVGLWASQLAATNKKALWMVPATFVSIMALGAALGMAHLAVPFTEVGIAASVLVLGVMVAAAVRMPLPASMALVGAFALCHGFAHGAEMPATASGMTYGLGFVVATAALHVSGIGLGKMVRKIREEPRVMVMRYAGAAIALCGVFLTFSKFSG